MTAPLAHSWALSPNRVFLAVAVTVSFALLAFLLRGVNRAGALAGGVACLILFICAGPASFATLVTLFVLTWAATRYRFGRKQQLGLSERGEGRIAAQVLANLGVATACSLLFGFTGSARWLLAMVAALAEASTDTVASEIGQTAGRTSRLITTWEPVPSGTDGGITIRGTVAGALAGLIVCSVAIATGIVLREQVWIAPTCGIIGMLFDSVLGATVQRRGRINNDGVNFASTLFAALLAFALPR